MFNFWNLMKNTFKIFFRELLFGILSFSLAIFTSEKNEMGNYLERILSSELLEYEHFWFDKVTSRGKINICSDYW